jgi:cytochrome bd-type quinol oxidase subunit 2
MKRAKPPCSSIVLLLRSSLPCLTRLTLTAANATSLDALRTLLAVCVQTVGGGTTSHQLAVRLTGALFILPANLMYTFCSYYVFPRKSEDW